MKLWLLKSVEGLSKGDNPWDPWYDKIFGFVIRAEIEDEARRYADANAEDENRGVFLGSKIANTNHPWLNPKYSTCIELTRGGRPGIIIEDYHGA